MKAPASVVCGVGHSSGARAAARFGAALADRLGSPLVLVHVVQPPIPQSQLGLAARRTEWEVIDELRRAGADLLAEVAQELGPGREAVAELKVGDAGAAIAAVAEEAGAELVVVGSRGLGSVGALVLGSVSRWLGAHAPCPTVVVPEPGGTIAGAPILCAVDEGEASRAALATAASLARRLDLQLLLVHAAADDAGADRGEELLARLAAESGLDPSVARLVVRGEPAEAIVEAATGRGAGLVAIGSRGRGALAAAALGSVSSAVASRAPCPVAIVRADAPPPAAG